VDSPLIRWRVKVLPVCVFRAKKEKEPPFQIFKSNGKDFLPFDLEKKIKKCIV
jgi:hypothetical protein